MTTGRIVLHEVDPEESEFEYSVEVHQPYGVLDDVLSWCRTNSVGGWGWRLIAASNRATDGRYRFYFNTESDATTFTLRWL